MLVRVFYVSEAVAPMSDVDLQVILGAAQIWNRRLDVTGMLAQSDGHFAQVLEGRSAAVAEVLQRVARDRHHTSMRIVLEESIERRQFARWAMGLVRRDDMAAEMAELHRVGCASPGLAHAMIDRLLRSPGGPGE